jgi:glycosyltransferase involved in cell wall biosynthesis
MPEITVVIPTLRRPALVERGIRSVLNQSYRNFEILVIVDGPDPDTDARLLEAMDSRVRVIELSENVGLAEARNVGIREARGRWVALLDDDDEWLPEKLEAQLSKGESLGGDYIFVVCKFIEKTLRLERVMPDRLPSGAAKFSEYIYCDQGYLQPSMFFMSRALALEVPFTRGLRHVEDSDWLLRATRHPQIQVGCVDRPLSIYYNYGDGKRESEVTPWQHPLKWAIDNHALFTRRAFPFYIARIGVNARRSGESVLVLLHLMRAAWRYGTFNVKVLGYFLAYWFLPDYTLRKMRRVFR